MVRAIADEFLVEAKERKYYADHYTCWPPPVFVPFVTLLQIAVFMYYCLQPHEDLATPPPVLTSPFLYRPDLRYQVWRFFFYAFLHAGWVHLAFNLLVQLLVGLPLEMVHGSLRICTIYMAGVLAGSLGTSVLDSEVYLVGASGGVYALLAAHLANVLINYSSMQYGVVRLVAVCLVASVDVGYAIYNSYMPHSAGLPVSYISHIMGALAGLVIGVVVLKNFSQKLHNQLYWWMCLGCYMTCVVFAVFYNLLSRGSYQGLFQFFYGSHELARHAY